MLQNFDFSLLKALQLPARVVGGIFLACFLLLIIDYFEWFKLQDFTSFARPALIVATIVSGCLLIASFMALFMEDWLSKRKASVLARRKLERTREKDAERTEKKRQALAHLDHLSKEEIKYVAQAIRGESPSFLTYVHSPPVALLMSKGLVYTPGSQHHQDYYPFSFHLFAWEEILKRRDEFLEKDRLRGEAGGKVERRRR